MVVIYQVEVDEVLREVGGVRHDESAKTDMLTYTVERDSFKFWYMRTYSYTQQRSSMDGGLTSQTDIVPLLSMVPRLWT